MTDLENRIKQQNDAVQENVKNLTQTQRELDQLRLQSQKLDKQLLIAQTVSEFHESCKY